MYSLGVKLTGTLQVCNGCAQSKENTRGVRKKTYTTASQPGERIFVDTTGPFSESLIGNWYWIVVVDNYKRYSWSFFTKTNDQLPKNMEEFFEKMTSRGTPVKYLRCNNSGEHQSKLQRVCKKEKVMLEYKTSHTPQMNGVIERRFYVIKEGALAILLNAKLNDTAQNILWEEAVHTCKRVRNSMATTGSTTSPIK